jgi:hypothetical protein
MAIGTGVDRLARGLALGQNLRAAEEQRGLAAEDQAFIRKQRAREETNWQQQDADRARDQTGRQLLAAYKRVRDSAYNLSSPAGQATLGYIRNMSNVFDTIDKPDPQALEAARKSFNEYHAEDIGKGTGVPLEKDARIGEGQILPKGSVINRKDISRVFPRQDGTLLFGVKSYATTPDGKPVEYESFVTQNRSTDDDDPVLAMPFDSLLKNVGDTMTLMDLVEREGQDKVLAMLEAELTALGVDIPTAPKLDEFKREEGDQVVTYQRDARGNVKEVARAPRWQPEKPEKAPTETWNNPVEETSTDGKRILVRYSNLGNRQVVEGATPKADKKTELTAKQADNARNKLQTVRVLRKQIENLKKARDGLGAMSEGIVAGRNPLSEAGSNYDAALAALQTTVRQLTRTPGEGAMSDYESRMAQAQLPLRADFPSSIDQKIAQLEDLANVVESGYSGLLGDESAPAAQSRTGPKQGDVEDGFTFKGGDPADPNNWERAQ